jgi:oxygen-independent coproporphyrinogen-3 oxidase
MLRESQRLGLYVHVPFCARHCEFCAFYERPPLRGDMDRYLGGACRELASLALPRRVDTVFWGGGTPGILTPRDMEELGGATLTACGGTPSEWTVEMTPATMRPERLRVLRDLGVNRLSMGVQSFDEGILRALGRLTTPEQVCRALDDARAAGFDNLNIDMMFALPGQSLEQWEADLRRAVALGTEHLSTYCLTLEEESPLCEKLAGKSLRRRSPEEEERFYRRTWELLEELGVCQYEVSNFARPGRECVHNLNTWRMQEWAGAGPSASSQIGGMRFTNVRSLEQWLAGLNSGVPARTDVVALDDRILAEDSLAFGLRMREGVNLEHLQARFPVHDWDQVREKAQELADASLAIFEDNRLTLTTDGLLVADAVAEEFIG